jgi:hypothetical protein
MGGCTAATIAPRATACRGACRLARVPAYKLTQSVYRYRLQCMPHALLSPASFTNDLLRSLTPPPSLLPRPPAARPPPLACLPARLLLQLRPAHAAHTPRVVQDSQGAAGAGAGEPESRHRQSRGLAPAESPICDWHCLVPWAALPLCNPTVITKTLPRFSLPRIALSPAPPACLQPAASASRAGLSPAPPPLSLSAPRLLSRLHIYEPTRQEGMSYGVLG